LDVNKCPNCKKGTLIYCEKITPVRGLAVYTQVKMAGCS